MSNIALRPLYYSRRGWHHSSCNFLGGEFGFIWNTQVAVFHCINIPKAGFIDTFENMALCLVNWIGSQETMNSRRNMKHFAVKKHANVRVAHQRKIFVLELVGLVAIGLDLFPKGIGIGEGIKPWIFHIQFLIIPCKMIHERIVGLETVQEAITQDGQFGIVKIVNISHFRTLFQSKEPLQLQLSLFNGYLE